MADALAGVLLFFLGYFFCKYRDLPTRKEAPAVPEEVRAEQHRQTEQIKAFHTMMDYDENTAYSVYSGGVRDE